MNSINSIRILCGLLLFAVAGCREPKLGLDLATVATTSGAARSDLTAIAVAPIARGAMPSGSRASLGLVLFSPDAGFKLGDLARMAGPGVAYPILPWEWREATVPRLVLARVVQAMLMDARFAGAKRTPDSALSIRIVRWEGGRPLVAEVFVDLAAAHAFAARLTDAGVGTDALRALFQWEMNL